MESEKPLWVPSAKTSGDTLLSRFIVEINRRFNQELGGYPELYQWSLEQQEQFWTAVWSFCEVIGTPGQRVLVDGQDIEKAIWFPEARLNFAENLLRRRDQGVAIAFWAEDQLRQEVSWDQLYREVAVLAAWMKGQGIGPGDRVAGYLPNMPASVVAMLATTSLGAIWTSTSPDFGKESVIERFGQTLPKLLFAADGYYYNGKRIDVRQKVREIVDALPSLQTTVVANLIGLPWDGLTLAEILHNQPAEAIVFTPMAFNDPLYILYSSGTTGKPKCIAHKIGGVLLQHLKELMLHSDVRPDDRVFYFTTCGWMMWNWLVSALACRATIMLYDGSPFYPDGNILWDYAQDSRATLFGTSAKYIDALKKQGYVPGESHDLSALKTLCSTGSVLVPESFDYVYASIKEDLCLSSISGGTDIVSCFVLGCPLLPVYRGECQCRGLGMAVEVFDSKGQPLIGEPGELVCTSSFPSQPCCFWGDEDGQQYHQAYFAEFPDVWHHGDYVSLSERGGITIYGRSDATLNPGGVRIGTAEIYRYVEQLEEVLESIAVGQEWQEDIRVILFVVLRSGLRLTESLESKIQKTIRDHCTPRHVPAKILQIDEVPRTKSGKIVELAVREVIHGRPVKNKSALANPEALGQFRNRVELQH